MNIMEQLAIVAAEATNEIQRGIMWTCLIALGVIVAGASAAWWFKVATPILGWVRKHKLQAVWIAPFVICCVYVGATKEQRGHVTFPYTDVEQRYLIDAGSYVTNDYVHVAFTKSALVPDSADLWGAVRPVGNTNDEDWVLFLGTTFAAFHSPSNVPFAGALTNDFQFFTTYTPGPVVHTNGVAVILWQLNYNGDTNQAVTIRTGIYENGFRVAPNPNITNGPSIRVRATLTESAENESEVQE